MSNFWAEKLGTNRPAAPVQQPYAPSSRPWWDDRPLPPAQPQQPSQDYPQQYQQASQEYAPHQAKSARLKERCPECSSANYMAPPGSQSRKRCWDCGYPLEQMGSSGISTSGQGEATPSRQIHDGSSQIVPGFLAHIESV